MTVAAEVQAPQWYLDAIATPAELGELIVEGVPIATRSWGEPGGEGIVLVHGGAAHARWWDHIAPLLTAHHRVVALDLSGHGDSGERTEYRLNTWAAEVLAVAASAGFAAPPTLVGHSMGGLVSLRAAAIAGQELTGLIVVDTPVSEAPPEDLAASDKIAFGPKRVYPTRADAVSHFRPVPAQATLPYVEAYVAENSVTENGIGWSWKFDPRIFGRPVITPEVLTRLQCRVAFFRAEMGMIDAAMEEVIYDGLGRIAPVIEIPQAAHHVMLDQPLALVTGIRTLLGEWDHSLPLA
jgi:pimeloyl-ACP methyl ester carboxylesterase